MPASEFGLTCLVAPTEDNLTVDVRVQFALYLQHFPTFEEQLKHAALTTAGDGTEAEDGGARQDGAASESSTETPKHSAGAVELDAVEISDMVPAVVGVQRDQERSSASRRRRREPGDLVQLVYQRYDVATTVRLTVPVPDSGVPITVDDRGGM